MAQSSIGFSMRCGTRLCRSFLWNKKHRLARVKQELLKIDDWQTRDGSFMSVRTKLLFGYLIFVAALVVLGGLSGWRLREMGGVARRIISNNYDSVVAAQEMKESLERQDSAALFALLGARDKAIAQLREHRASFDDSFKKAESNITEAGER